MDVNILPGLAQGRAADGHLREKATCDSKHWARVLSMGMQSPIQIHLVDTRQPVTRWVKLSLNFEFLVRYLNRLMKIFIRLTPF